MADKTKKTAGNVEGKYYVDEECIDCNLCSELASDTFKVNLQEGFDYVYQQPTTKEQIKLVEEAIHCCPVDAIGSDGLE